MIQAQNIEFMLSAASPKQYPDPDRPEIALAGRSNVGKSSFINTMTNHKKIARISSKPGKTQQLNYYNLDNSLYLVDVPGYGYAKVSKTERSRWQKQLADYFIQRENLEAVFLLVDFRHRPSKDDINMKDFLDQCQVPYFIIATKADKVKKNQWQNHLQAIKEDLDLVTEDQILPYSSANREGRDEAWEVINALLAGDYDE
ncbi:MULTISPECIES: ribosome biogenesis GTP-binding protein YihA/YsxC [Aerococcus]|uniref:ribosome biogenesis GTP-binding protein YihA/YsxC n=1 Tax=Aerococcus TaxID=1375 RepID=UPI000DCB71FF|nr:MULTISPECIES: ribosome biogenesis GTP-binding protein YihA/YsxC [Aerococcus]MDL5183630.1 ribosome biogenesis GTP-binding protein YihA/YsxC [Aerococcus mictus]MDK6291448.1 ribosome biogenesis GTP-binding protein YihA/YsxC [Aerococcus urinae]MDK6375878.1 ribosome biogenesis GTP-binding protein YihA/YsxC [Aerococcus urinae]MDK6421312.1 ribosome biogenesis GTP-binding protein YihA/YsxC [Aerococcus urinae]MDK8075838.1 ribosome biogenesis GTP-binding protein YihA/YsxC [Aerococcus urinae]